jgi:hypothetical protein
MLILFFRRGRSGGEIVDILEALGLHGPQLFLVALAIAILIGYFSFWLGFRLIRTKK